jgi:hypothetical protein
LLTNGVTYYVLSDKWWVSRTYPLQTSRTFPSSYTSFNVIAGYFSSWDSTSQLPNITDITTQWLLYIDWPMDTDKRIYTASDLFLETLLWKTDATYIYKLPDYPRIAVDDYAIWNLVKYDFAW